jgi:hypothetical protein
MNAWVNARGTARGTARRTAQHLVIAPRAPRSRAGCLEGARNGSVPGLPSPDLSEPIGRYTRLAHRRLSTNLPPSAGTEVLRPCRPRIGDQLGSHRRARCSTLRARPVVNERRECSLPVAKRFGRPRDDLVQERIELAEPKFVGLPRDEHRDAVRLLVALLKATTSETRHGTVPGCADRMRPEEDV